MKKALYARVHKKRILAMIVVMALIWSVMPIAQVWGQDMGEEPEIVMGDLEGPDYIPPPKHYKTREMMLAEAGLAMASPGPPPVPVGGTRELLALLVEFSDVAHNPTHTVAHFNDRFFDTAPPSVRDYYTEVSYGTFTYVPGAVMGWYPSTSTQASYIGPPRNHYPVFAEAIGDVDPFFNFGPYDTDNNGVVENEELTLFMIVSGNQGGAFHTWNRPNVVTADTNAFGNPVSVEGEYSVTHENRHIGSYCHELGHDLGLPDLYDTDPQWDGTSTTGLSEGIGNYGLMGGGSWTFSHMTAWSKIQLGWITPTIVTIAGDYDVHDAETNAEAYVLIDPAYSADEYFLIENRHPTNSYYETVGPPVAPSGTFPDEGIVIYHIDETRIQDWINFGRNNVNVDETHKGVDVECADSPTSHVINADDLDAEVNRGDANDLWDINEYDFDDASAPCNANWHVAVSSNLDVHDFPAASTTMRVHFSVVPFYDVGISVTPTLISVEPTETAVYTIEVTNLGNTLDSFDIALTFFDFGGAYRAFPTSIPSSWWSIDKTLMTLNPSDSDIATLTITVPQDWAGMETATYTFEATATSHGDPTVDDTASAALEVMATKRSMAEYIRLEILWKKIEVAGSGVDARFKWLADVYLEIALQEMDKAIEDIANGLDLQANRDLSRAIIYVRRFSRLIDSFTLTKEAPLLAEEWKQQAQQIVRDIATAMNTPI